MPSSVSLMESFKKGASENKIHAYDYNIGAFRSTSKQLFCSGWNLCPSFVVTILTRYVIYSDNNNVIL